MKNIWLVWTGLIWVGWGAVALAVGANPPVLLEASKTQVKGLVIQSDGKVSELSPESEPPQLQGCLSEVVEKFLRRAIRDYEDLQNPPKYSALIYIVPGDDLGLIGKNGQAKSIRPEDLPATTQKSIGGE